MSTTVIIIIAAVVVILIILVAIAVLYTPRDTETNVMSRLEEYANRSESVTLEQLEMSQPFSERVIIPILNNISTSVTRFTPKEAIEKTRRDLEMGGRPVRSPELFFGIRGGLGIFLAIMLTLITTLLDQPWWAIPLGGLIGFALGFILPGSWLGGKISARQEEIIKSLPDALDLLVICVEAGLGFEGAMAKVAEKWDNELATAFARALQEIRLGKLRNHALREMELNMGVADMTSFVAAIIQATQFGVSISKVLRIQSEQMRIKRRQRAEQKAQEAPIKMLFPMVFLIFPSLFIILLGPAVLLMMESGVIGQFT